MASVHCRSLVVPWYDNLPLFSSCFTDVPHRIMPLLLPVARLPALQQAAMMVLYLAGFCLVMFMVVGLPMMCLSCLFYCGAAVAGLLFATTAVLEGMSYMLYGTVCAGAASSAMVMAVTQGWDKAAAEWLVRLWGGGGGGGGGGGAGAGMGAGVGAGVGAAGVGAGVGAVEDALGAASSAGRSGSGGGAAEDVMYGFVRAAVMLAGGLLAAVVTDVSFAAMAGVRRRSRASAQQMGVEAGPPAAA